MNPKNKIWRRAFTVLWKSVTMRGWYYFLGTYGVKVILNFNFSNVVFVSGQYHFWTLSFFWILYFWALFFFGIYDFRWYHFRAIAPLDFITVGQIALFTYWVISLQSGVTFRRYQHFLASSLLIDITFRTISL